MGNNRRTKVMFIVTQIIFAAVIAGFAIVYMMTGKSSVSSDRSALIALLTVGLGLCFCGILFNVADGSGRHDRLVIFAKIIGAVLLIIFIGALFGFAGFHSYRTIMYVVVVLMLVKIASATVHHLK